MRAPHLRTIFRPAELRSLRAKILLRLRAARLQSQTDFLKQEWQEAKDDDPDDYFWNWERELKALTTEFVSNRVVYTRFKSAQSKLKKLKEQMQKDWQDKDGSLQAASVDEDVTTERSIFEDVDA